MAYNLLNKYYNEFIEYLSEKGLVQQNNSDDLFDANGMMTTAEYLWDEFGKEFIQAEVINE